MASPRCVMRCVRSLRRHCRGRVTRPPICTRNDRRQLCAVGSWGTSCTDDNSNFPHATAATQVTTKGGTSEHVPASWTSRTRQLWVCLRAISNDPFILTLYKRIQKLGQVSQNIFPKTDILRPGTGDVFEMLGFFIGLLLWAFGLLWLFFAVASIIRTRKFPFNLGWWAFTFPLGVYATSTCQLGREMPSRFFRVLGTVC